MAVKMHIRLKAASLVETLTAMVIITIAFTAGFMIFSNVSKSGRSSLRTQAHQRSLAYLAEVKSTGDFTDRTITEAGIQLQSSFKPFHDAGDVIHMHIIARAGDNKILYQHHELLYDVRH